MTDSTVTRTRSLNTNTEVVVHAVGEVIGIVLSVDGQGVLLGGVNGTINALHSATLDVKLQLVTNPLVRPSEEANLLQADSGVILCPAQL